MTLSQGYYFLFSSSQQLPSLCLRPLKSFLSCPSRALDLPHALLPDLQFNKDTVRYASLGGEVPGQEQLSQTLIDSAFVKTHFFLLKMKRPGSPLAPLMSN